MVASVAAAARVNAAAATSAFDSCSRACRHAIRTKDVQGEINLRRLAVVALGAKMEACLLALAHEAGGLSPSARSRVLNARTQEGRWRRLIDEAFAARHNLSHSQIPGRLQFGAQAQHRELLTVVTEQLVPIIALRNCIAHGQSERALNTSETGVNSKMTAELQQLSLWRLRILNNLLDHLLLMLRSALISRTAFERDFDQQYANIKSGAIRLRNGDEVKWRRQIEGRHERGAPWKRPTGPTVSRLTSDRLFAALDEARLTLEAIRDNQALDRLAVLRKLHQIHLAQANLQYDLTGASDPPTDELWAIIQEIASLESQ